jgi:2'-5' RNA ligase
VKVATSSGRPQSALLVPVPAAEVLVGPARLEHDPVAAAGVPAHVTLIVPWVDPDILSADDRVVPDLARELAHVKAFDFELTGVRWFDERVLWLSPEPVEPFLELTGRLAARFRTPPWAGKFSEVVPHLTVAHAGTGGPLDQVAEGLAAQLPAPCRADEVWAMVGDGPSWRVHARVPLA